MSLGLTQEQRQAIVESGGAPVEVSDAEIRCYLIAAEEFEKVKRLLELEEIDPSLFEFSDVELSGRNDE
jgi:hypothetical protein